LPAFRHEVQTFTRRRVPGATSARTVCTFGFQRRWVRRWECETDMPKPGPLPQTSQWLATMASSRSQMELMRTDVARALLGRNRVRATGQ
jgi:hypothetical protein